MSVKRRIFLVDDHPIVRLGMAELINREKDLEVCGDSDMLSSIATEPRNKAHYRGIPDAIGGLFPDCH